MENKKIVELVQKAINNVDYTKVCHDGGTLTVLEDSFVNTDNGYDSFVIAGGLNGRGIWSNYFEALAKAMFQIELLFPNAFVVKIDNDVVDDVFYMTVGIPD
jgi:hypothetical protein